MTDNNTMLSKLPYSKDEVAFLQAEIRAFSKLTMMTAPDESDDAAVWNDSWNQTTLPKLICIVGKLLEYASSCYHTKNVQGGNQPCQDNVNTTTVTSAGGNKRAKVDNSNVENAEKANTKTNKDDQSKSKVDDEKNEEEPQGKRHNTQLMPTSNTGNDWNNTTNSNNSSNTPMRNNNNVEVDPEEVAMNTSSLQPFTHEEFVEENNYLLGEMEELLITPFTISRLLELLLNPFAHYTDANGELRGEAIQAALRRCILVSSPAMKSVLAL